MSFIVLHGTYHVKGRDPDGDSVAFMATDPRLWERFDWAKPSKRPTLDRNKPVQLRIEGIDALETHYQGYYQPKAIAKSATHELLTAFGVVPLAYSLNFTKIIEAEDGAPGAIISKGLDGYDRPVSFALLGDHGLEDGEELDALTADLVEQTVNWRLASAGVVYPTFYRGMDETALAVLSRASADALADKRGLWTFIFHLPT